MTSKCLIFPLLTLFFVCCLAACEKHEVTEEAREQARQSEGIYDVEGQMILSPFRDDTVPKRVSFNGVAHVVIEMFDGRNGGYDTCGLQVGQDARHGTHTGRD